MYYWHTHLIFILLNVSKLTLLVAYIWWLYDWNETTPFIQDSMCREQGAMYICVVGLCSTYDISGKV